ncbi:rhomboid family intramembrane serine protease [Paraconexibacter antarcticus]|uniref:Rhomboid family intramembrane serine protease n=1 Tax=Paraconexibacter antarcticus TaxID=2949664 RepID=A0ABY5DWI2_9ACTN|nr:rhomboid family intramembrane serine protease [Paraconexibacter antarcticus]UTI66365.1 rhomboid family intramembrane serine protease [Paraconexibacter antarcticus]
MSTPGRDATPSDPRKEGALLVLAMVAVMWVVEIIDSLDSQRLDRYGIEPRHLDGLRGIVTAPFLHASFSHLFGNTIPFLVLGIGIALSGAARVAAVTAIVAVVGGVGTWFTGASNSVHIGASGLVFGFAAYLISRALFSRSWLHLGAALLVGFLYGSTLGSGLIPQDGISWQGHLFGGVGGVLAAKLLDSRGPRAAPRRADPLAGL